MNRPLLGMRPNRNRERNRPRTQHQDALQQIKSGLIACAVLSFCAIVIIFGLCRRWADNHTPITSPEAPHDPHFAFDMYIDPRDPSQGSFVQNFTYDLRYWQGSGSPIILHQVPRWSLSREGWQHTIELAHTEPLFYAMQLGAAVIYTDGRDFDAPKELTFSKANQYRIWREYSQDVLNFGMNASLPFDSTGDSRPDVSPWIVTGCAKEKERAGLYDITVSRPTFYGTSTSVGFLDVALEFCSEPTDTDQKFHFYDYDRRMAPLFSMIDFIADQKYMMKNMAGPSF
ncbi:hypothetical protein GLAREA_06648 [Glarea lozoyensis ATCC 20868]|uniref:Uncharacterized protein n=1 Tax=Glarea lozoyensis (strain ATCC 20868 / MF5171) TaxID=1116229 RepID=S3D765_GLAL2|nr:uncharacterized protein GLAREA_06648 [Glarea lozoyensis ATCC 20868]EPE33635.1 hypothetical protein GLAREA_06648 [Glarea lozoyensis ATCC 20868]